MLSLRLTFLVIKLKVVDLKVVDLKVDLKSLRLVNLTGFHLWRLTPNGGECEMVGHFLKTRLVDDYQSNNKDILGQMTQKTQQSNKG